MALPLVSDVYSRARAMIGDDLVTAGEIFTDSKLQPHYQTAYAELWRELDRIDSTFLDTDAFYIVPAYTSFVDPATAGIANLGELLGIEERGTISSVTVSAATPGTASLAVTTGSAHGRATGEVVILSSMGGLTLNANGPFTITVTGASAFTANGCTATGTYTSGGVASYSTEGWSELQRVDRIEDYPTTSGTALQVFSYRGDIIRTFPANAARQIRVRYSMSGSAPTTTTQTILLDDSVDFLAARTGQLASGTRGMPETEERLKNMAARYIDTILDNAVKALQRLPAYTRQPSSYAVRPRQYWA